MCLHKATLRPVSMNIWNKEEEEKKKKKSLHHFYWSPKK